MASSNEISQMFSSQNSMFMGQNSYAQSIGVGPGLGGWGSSGGGGGGHAAPFSYSPSAMMGGGFGGGNKFAGIGMSAMGGAASVGAALAFDPFGSFLGGAAGGLARGGFGAAMSGGFAAALPMMPIAAAAQMGIGGLMRGGQQQGAINTVLGQNFGFPNPMSRTGAGFTRDDAKAIGDSVRSLSHIPEMMTSVEELTRLMPKLKSSGVMQGVKNATEFQHRFKEAISTIRDMSKVLGTTMEEAEQFFAHSRSMGFTGRSGQLRNTLNAQVTSGLTGMNMGQVMGLQQAGAGMAMQFGARRSLGANAVTNIAQRIGLAQREGGIEDGLIENVTGMSGAEGVQAASQKMAGFLMQMSQTAPGRAIMAGAVKFDDRGRAIGLDTDIIKKLNEGRMSLDELKRRGGSLTNAQKISFTARSADLGADFAGKVDMGRFMQGLVGNKGGDAANLVLQRLTGGQASSQDIDLMMAMGGGTGMGGELQQMGKLRAREAAFRERTDPSAVLRRIKTRLHSSTLGGIEQAGAKIFSEMGKAYDSFIDDLVGRHAVTLSKEGADAIARAMSGGGKDDLKQMLAAASGLKQGAAAMREMDRNTPFAAKSLRQLASSFRDSEMGAFLMRGDSDSGRSASGRAAFSREMVGGGLSDAGMQSVARMFNRGIGGADGAAAGDALRSIRAGISGFSGMDDDRKLSELRSAVESRIISAGGAGGIGVPAGTLLHKLKEEGPGATDEWLKKNGVKGGLQEALTKMEMSGSESGRDAARLLRAGIAAQKAGAADMLTGIVAAAQGEFKGEDMQIDFKKAISGSGAATLQDALAFAQKNLENSTANLTKGTWRGGAGLDDTEASVLNSSPEARKVISDLLGDGKNNASIRAALSMRDPEAAAKKLGELGYAVKPSEIEALQGIRNKADSGAAGTIKKHVEAQKNADLAASGVAFTALYADKAKEMGALIESSGLSGESLEVAKAVQAAYAKVGEGNTSTLEGDIQGVDSSMRKLTDAIAKGGPDVEKLVAATGMSGEAAQAAVEMAKGLKGKKRITQEEAMKMFRLSGTEGYALLERNGISGGAATAVGSIDVEKLQAEVAKFKEAGSTARKDTQVAEMSTDEKLLKTLGDLNKNMALSTAVMAASQNVMGDSKNKDLAERVQQNLKEQNSTP